MRRAVFAMGLPGSGKSTVIRRWMSQTSLAPRVKLFWLDCDRYKESHPDYDPLQPGKLHAWSVEQTLKDFSAALALPPQIEVLIIVDGTGAAKGFCAKMREAAAAGFSIELLVVETPIDLCYQRIMRRERKVPWCVMLEKDAGIKANFPEAFMLAKGVQRFNGETGHLTATYSTVVPMT